MENSTTGNEIWFYELNGERKGAFLKPISSP